MSKASGRFGRRFMGSDIKDAEEGSSDTMSEDRSTTPTNPGIHIHVTTVVEQEEERAEEILQNEGESARGTNSVTQFQRA